MNDQFSPELSEEESQENKVVRRPRLRARRTIAPFSELKPATAQEEIDGQEENEEALANFAEPSETAFPEEQEASLEETEETGDPEMSKEIEGTVQEASQAGPIEDPYKDAEEEKKDKGPTLSTAGNVFDWIKSFLFSLAAVVFVFTLIFRGVTVNGGSMLPTLHDKEYLIISNLSYTPKTGDIVVVQSPHYKNGTEPLIKRIIATEGQIVRINFNTWEVFVNDKLLKEDYILRDGASTMNCEDLIPDENGIAEVVVEENCVFVMGDHRNDSLDSRSNAVGQIDERYIMGRVILRITPLSRFGKVS